jgi:hypothetical protein
MASPWVQSPVLPKGKRKIWNLHVDMTRCCEDTSRRWCENRMIASKPGTPEATRSKELGVEKILSQPLQSEQGPADTLILDLEPPGLRQYISHVLNHPVCWASLWKPWEENSLMKSHEGVKNKSRLITSQILPGVCVHRNFWLKYSIPTGMCTHHKWMSQFVTSV